MAPDLARAKAIARAAALLVEPAERSALFDAACGGDAHFRAAVEDFLRAEPSTVSGAVFAPGETTVDRLPLPAPATPVVLIGSILADRYTILNLLGEGGMGAVYLAEQTQPVRRRVAVKMIKAGADTARVVTRFESERQALALLDHPHIAKVFDAGTAPWGVPFFVMDLADGAPLNEFCDSLRLPVAERLLLFAKVCAAVQHAHQKGIIHRDLKPGNILVSAGEGEPTPKIIDFGLAKAVGPGLVAGDPTLTASGAILGTPLYMAPEQAGGTPHDVDTRADVYALGVILYELLTGTTPLDRMRARKLGLTEILRMVREDEPPSPSARVVSAADAMTVAENRRTDSTKLARLVRGELDWVVMKALAKDRDRRYQSVTALADDVVRFLKHEPVSAGPPSRWYAVRKFARRHRVPAVAAGLVLLTLLGGVIGTTWGLVRALDAEGMARDEEGKTLAALVQLQDEQGKTNAALVAEKEQRQRAVRTVEDMLVALGKKLSDTTDVPRVRLEMYEKALALYRRFAAEPGGDTPELRRKMAETYDQMALLKTHLNQDVGAEADYTEAIRLYRSLADAPLDETLPLLNLVERYALVLRKQGRLKAAVPLFEEVSGGLAEAVAKRPNDELVEAHSTRVAGEFATLLTEVGANDRALALFRKTLERDDATLQSHPEWGKFRTADAKFRVMFADACMKMFRRPADAKPLYEAALPLLEQLQELNPESVSAVTDLSGCISNYASCLDDLKLLREKQRLQERTKKNWERLGKQFPDMPEYKHSLALLVVNTKITSEEKEVPEVEADLRSAAGVLSELANRYPKVAEYRRSATVATSNVAVLLVMKSKPADAIPFFEEARRNFLAMHPDGPTTAADKDTFFRQRKGHGFALWTLDRFGAAAEAFAEAVKFAPNSDAGEEATALVLGMQIRQGKTDAAVREIEQLLTQGKFRGKQAFHAAEVFGEAFSATAEPDRKEVLAKRATELLGTAVEAGYQNLGHLKTAPAFRDFRPRQDYLEVIRRVGVSEVLRIRELIQQKRHDEAVTALDDFIPQVRPDARREFALLRLYSLAEVAPADRVVKQVEGFLADRNATPKEHFHAARVLALLERKASDAAARAVLQARAVESVRRAWQLGYDEPEFHKAIEALRGDKGNPAIAPFLAEYDRKREVLPPPRLTK